ncbi:Multiple RNA-binding domain-containing protein 1 [Balamuthia mandrillaris]
MRFHAWNLTEFERLIYMDCDIMLLDNIDEHLPLLRNKSTQGINSGLLVLRPGAGILEELIAEWLSLFPTKGCINDQPFLRQFFDRTERGMRWLRYHPMRLYHMAGGPSSSFGWEKACIYFKETEACSPEARIYEELFYRRVTGTHVSSRTSTSNSNNMASTRICVKNLPKHVKEDRLKEHFSQKGEITDVKILRTKDGRSRMFGFIGFRTAEEAKQARAYFNNTFLDTSKITVEKARPQGDEKLGRAWSKYSQGSSRFEERQKKQNANTSAAQNKRKRKLLDEEEEGEDEKTNKEKESKEFQEFMMVNKPRTSAQAPKLWGNDDLALVDANKEDSSRKKKRIKRKTDDGAVVDLIAVPNRKPGGQGTFVTRTRIKFEDDGEKANEAKQNQKSMFGDDDDDDEEEAEKERENLLMDGSSDDELYEDLPPHKAQNKTGNGNMEEEEQEEEEEEQEEEEEENEEGIQTNYSKHDKRENKPAKENTKNIQEKITHPVSKERAVAEIGDTGRLFIRNLAFTTTEEDLHKLFKKFGQVSEVHIVINKETKQSTGLAFVKFMFPQHAVDAFTALDGSIFQGRLIHILPAAKKENEENGTQSNSADSAASAFKKQKEAQLQETSQSDHNWNPLLLRTDAVLEAVAGSYGLSKGDILDKEEGSMATRVAISETKIINETKKYFEQEGISFNELNTALAASQEAKKKMKRSGTTILVKNLPFTTSNDELHALFSKYGTLARIVLPPSKAIAVVEFLESSEARKAFKSLAYTKFHHVPLYLEWAPEAILSPSSSSSLAKSSAGRTTDQPQSVEAAKREKERILEDEEIDSFLEGKARTLFIKNLNFSTEEDTLRAHFQEVGTVRAVTIAKKNNQGRKVSLGYGFVEFARSEDALKAIKNLQGKTLEGHALELKFAKPTSKAQPTSSKKKQSTATFAQKPTPKLLVKNVAFETTKKELRELFGTFGQVKSVRLPKKMGGQNRGFAFVDFLTKQEAKSAMEQLQHTHLYGRHLVLEYAKEEKASLS